MIDVVEAEGIIRQKFPEATIPSFISYGNLFVFMVFFSDPDEGIFDPFYSVDKTTGEVAEFSVFTDGEFDDIQDLFIIAQGGTL